MRGAVDKGKVPFYNKCIELVYYVSNLIFFACAMLSYCAVLCAAG